MFLAWVIWPKKKFTIAIIDKTVLKREGQEHISLTWVLNNQKYSLQLTCKKVAIKQSKFTVNTQNGKYSADVKIEY